MQNNFEKQGKELISIVIYSSDAYEDCWIPFFELFHKNFATSYEYEILLLTNTKEFCSHALRVKTIKCGIRTPWSKRLKIGIEKANSEIIFLIGDDFFLLEKMNKTLFDQQVNLMVENSKIDHIRLLHKPNKFKSTPSSYQYLNKIDEKTKYRFLFAPSLWKRESLIQYIVDFESPFMAEKMGTYRARILKHGFYCMSEEFMENYGKMYSCGTSGMIVKGKWAKWTVPIIKEKGLDIVVEKRGVREETEKKGSIFKARMQQLYDPISTIKSYISIVLLYFDSKLNPKI
jgi:hypothetical protein